MVNIHIIGCGGVGSWIVHFIRRAFPDPQEVRLILWDGDTVEEKNLPHSNFQIHDIGKQKSKVLASRYNAVGYGNWDGEKLTGDIVICAVDDLTTRKRIIQMANSCKIIDVRAEGKSWQVFLGSSKLIGTFVNGRNPDERRGCQDGNIIPDFGNVVAAAYVAQIVKSIITGQPLPRSEWWGEVLGEAGQIVVQGGGEIAPATCCICGTKISRGAVDRDGAVYCPSCSRNHLPIGEVGMMGDRPVLILEDRLKVWREIVNCLRNLNGWQLRSHDIKNIELRTTVLSAPVLTPIGIRYLEPVVFRVVMNYENGTVKFVFAVDVPRGFHPHLNETDICWGEWSRHLISCCPADKEKVLKALETNLETFRKLLSDGMNEGYSNPLDCLLLCHTVSKPYKTVEEFQELLKSDPIYKYRESGGKIPWNSGEKLRLLQKLTGQLKEEETEEVQIPRIDWRQAMRYYELHPLTQQQAEPEGTQERQTDANQGRITSDWWRWWEYVIIPGVNSPFIRIIYAPPTTELNIPEDIPVIVKRGQRHFYPPPRWYRVIFNDFVIGAISPDFRQILVREGHERWVTHLRALAHEVETNQEAER